MAAVRSQQLGTQQLGTQQLGGSMWEVTMEHMTTTPCCTLWLNIDKTLIVDAQQDVLLVASYLPPVGSPAAPFRILSDELEVRARGRQVVLLGDLNARVDLLPLLFCA